MLHRPNVMFKGSKNPGPFSLFDFTTTHTLRRSFEEMQQVIRHRYDIIYNSCFLRKIHSQMEPSPAR